MKLNISYTKEKDIENFLNGQKAINRPTPTEVEEEFSKRFNNFDSDNLSSFIDDYTKEEKYDIPAVINKFTQQWSEAEARFAERCDTLFGVTYPLESVTAYITLNNRCTYNTEGGYFFLSVRAYSAVKSIMHELLHFYTLEAFAKRSKELSLTPLRYNDIKESLTVLLNTEFKDLMGDAIDNGYPQHQDMRMQILAMREKGLSVSEIFDKLARS